MDRHDLIRKLNAVGKEAFVAHYTLFMDYAAGTIRKDAAIQALIDAGRSNYAGASIRLGNASIIFNNKCQCEALKIIMSARVSATSKIAATKLLERPGK